MALTPLQPIKKTALPSVGTLAKQAPASTAGSPTMPKPAAAGGSGGALATANTAIAGLQKATAKPVAPALAVPQQAKSTAASLNAAYRPQAQAAQPAAQPAAPLPATAAFSAQPSAQQQALLAADQRPMTVADNAAARAYDLGQTQGPTTGTTVLAGRGPGINPKTGERYTPQELADLAKVPSVNGVNGESFALDPVTGQPITKEEQAAQGTAARGAYDAARAADLNWQKTNYPAMYAANEALKNPDGSRQGTWVPDPNNPSDDPNSWIWQPYVADSAWLSNGNTAEGPFARNPVLPQQNPNLAVGKAPQGLDMTIQGPVEEFVRDNAWQYMLPTADTEAGTWWGNNQDSYWKQGAGERAIETSKAGGLQEQGVAEKVFDEQQGQFFGPEGDLSKYYDNAERRAEEKLRTSMASRGMLGSSATDDQVSEMLLNLESEKANREAQFNLDRTKAGVDASLGVGNQQTQRAVSALDAFKSQQELEQDRLNAGQSITSALDQAALGRTNAGVAATSAAQGAQRARGQDYIGNTMNLGNATSGVIQDSTGKALTADKTLLDDIMAMFTGAGAQRLSNAQYNENASANQANSNKQLIAYLASMFSGGGGD